MAKKKAGKTAELPKGLQRALAERKASADSEALLMDLIDVWGGTRQLALDLHKEFQSAAAGGMTRQRILEMLHRLVVNNTNHKIGQSSAPSDMSDEELDEKAMSYVARVTNAAPTAA